MFTSVTIIFLVIMQLFLLVNGCIRLKRNILDFCGYINILYFIFFSIPAWDIYYEWGLFSHLAGYGYGGYTKDQILLFIFITTSMALLFEFGYFICTKTIDTQLIRGSNLYGLKAYSGFSDLTYKLICIILFAVWIIVIINEYIDYGGSLLTFLLPARKQGIKSGIEGMIQIMFPEILLLLVMIKNWDSKYFKRRIIFPTLIMLISISISAQRRDMIQAILLLGMMVVIKRMQGSGQGDFKQKKRKRGFLLYIFLGILAIALIPLLWYARNYSTQLSRGVIERDPFSIHTYSELIFGSSSSGFDSFLIVDTFDKYYEIPFLYCLRYFFSFWIPRSIYSDKIMQLTLMMQQKMGAQGNISLFYVNDLYFSFKWLAIIFAPISGYIVGNAYIRSMKKREISELIIGIYMFSQVILLFKNGIAAFATWMVTFVIIYRMSLFICRNVQFNISRGGV